jgi:hypothetical protein
MRAPQTFVITLIPAEDVCSDDRIDPATGSVAHDWQGKVLHITSGRRENFTSMDDLITFVSLCLSEIQTTDSGRPTTEGGASAVA